MTQPTTAEQPHVEGVPPQPTGIELASQLRRALTQDHPGIARLGAAETTVTFAVPPAPEQSVTLLLDRQPPVVVSGPQDAEITIELTREQAARFARGALKLPNALITEEVASRGPVRKYLVIDPVLRALLVKVHNASLPERRPTADVPRMSQTTQNVAQIAPNLVPRAV